MLQGRLDPSGGCEPDQGRSLGRSLTGYPRHNQTDRAEGQPASALILWTVPDPTPNSAAIFRMPLSLLRQGLPDACPGKSAATSQLPAVRGCRPQALPVGLEVSPLSPRDGFQNGPAFIVISSGMPGRAYGAPPSDWWRLYA
jgi:hypothetical protein